eukprot:scaffold301413_cov18-Tisochrysis_lutea.AAC.1
MAGPHTFLRTQEDLIDSMPVDSSCLCALWAAWCAPMLCVVRPRRPTRSSWHEHARCTLQGSEVLGFREARCAECISKARLGEVWLWDGPVKQTCLFLVCSPVCIISQLFAVRASAGNLTAAHFWPVVSKNHADSCKDCLRTMLSKCEFGVWDLLICHAF